MNPLQQQTPMQLLNVVADQALTSSLAKYISEVQLACQAHCEAEIERSSDENQALSDDSTRALERQCNKQCAKKFIKSFTLYNQMLKQQ